MDLYYFTFTGHCKRIAEMVAEKLKLRAKEIMTHNLPYAAWLLLSFLPYIAVKIDVEPPKNERILLCFPKWTFNCPPVTAFLRKYAKGREVRMVICYGGFDEKRYARFYRDFALRCGATKADYTLVKRRELKEYPKIVEDKICRWLNADSNFHASP